MEFDNSLVKYLMMTLTINQLIEYFFFGLFIYIAS